MKNASSSGVQRKPSDQNKFDILNDASGLVGSIVEKGFSGSSQKHSLVSAPRPTVLPFPVARHRSHGPHWAPKRSAMNIERKNDEDGEEGEDTDLDSVAAFANPVQKKEKKTIDFSNWRDITSDDYSAPQDKKRTKNLLDCQPKKQLGKSLKILNEANSPISADNDVDMKEADPTPMVVDNIIVRGNDKLNTMRQNKAETYKTPSLGDEESQIDVENRAQLKKMSAAEIAEAQAELMNKMSPELINLLKKRGQDKLKKQKLSSSDPGEKLKDQKILLQSSESDISQEVATVTSKDTGRSVHSDDVGKLGTRSGSLWDSWSNRVEAVRDLRFSLDGDVIYSDFGHISQIGESVNSGYSTNNVSERDLLRTHGDPAAVGYTIQEALALARSVIPGQRSIALHLLTSVLDKASGHISQYKEDCTSNYANTDWEAIWAFALGPEPELVLVLRMSLDDNHNSVVLACARVIQSVLTFDINERFFDTSEKIPDYQKDLYTSPIFRSRPQIDDGFLKGGFWKYNTKPSTVLLPYGDDVADDNAEAEHTIKDDIALAGQDFAAGLVRMGVIPRLCFLLEEEPSEPLEECILSILIAIARHSPICADAVMKCQRLIDTIVNRFTTKNQMEINLSKIKSVTLLKVLARSEKKNCVEFVKGGTFQKVTWHLYKYAMSADSWQKSGKDKCKLSSPLLVEQLRFWKVCILYGFCISSFADLFPALSMWLTVPNFEKLIEEDILTEYVDVSRESYLLLNALSKWLPNLYSKNLEVDSENMETWSWSYVGPMVDFGLKWLALKSEPYLSNCSEYSVLWVVSAVTHMLSTVLKSAIPKDSRSLTSGHVPWLPDFVPKIGLEIIKNNFFTFKGFQDASFFMYLCTLKHQSEPKTSLAATCCLQGLVEVVISVNVLIRLGNPRTNGPRSNDDKVLTEGVLKSFLVEMKGVLATIMKTVVDERQHVQSIETFARGGPAPGVGVGWGTPRGGFWSDTTLLARVDAAFVIQLLEICPILSTKDSSSEELTFMMQMVNCALDLCLVIGPRDKPIIDKVFNLLLQAPVLKYLTLFIQRFIHNKGLKLFSWEYTDEDYFNFSNILVSHYKSRWLSIKKKNAKTKNVKNMNFPLATIREEFDMPDQANEEHDATSLISEWAHQRTPLPMHWFLSSISTIDYSKSNAENNTKLLEIAKAGLFFILGIEAMSALISPELNSSVQSVPIVWKFHALSVILFLGMGVFEDDKSRDIYENLQELYGQILDNSRLPQIEGEKYEIEILKFQSEVHESYSTFIETLVDQFSAVSFGDLIYGRQVSIYLHRCVEASVRLDAWNSLSNIRALELLPPLEKCVGNSEGYLEPAEDNESILEAYVKSWVTGALYRAAARKSVSYTLVLHHVSSFIYSNSYTGDKLSLRNKLVKSLLRDYSRKQKHEGMMMSLIRYNHKHGEEEILSVSQVGERFKLLRDACEGNSTLLSEVEKLELTKEKNGL